MTVFVGGWGSSMYQYAYDDPNLRRGDADSFTFTTAPDGDDARFDSADAGTGGDATADSPMKLEGAECLVFFVGGMPGDSGAGDLLL